MDDLFFGGLRACQFARYPSMAHDEDPARQRSNFREVTGDHQDGNPADDEDFTGIQRPRSLVRSALRNLRNYRSEIGFLILVRTTSR
jgi:hypothetical protein